MKIAQIFSRRKDNLNALNRARKEKSNKNRKVRRNKIK